MPSILLILCLPPKNKPAAEPDGKMVWVVLERAGQVGCIVALCTATGFYYGKNQIWMSGMIACICIYYTLWGRYLVKRRDYAVLFMPFAGIPVPMAVFPIGAFLFAACWGESIWLGVATVLFGIGHIANSLRCYRQIKP